MAIFCQPNNLQQDVQGRKSRSPAHPAGFAWSVDGCRMLTARVPPLFTAPFLRCSPLTRFIARAAADPARSERNPVKLSREGLLCGCFLAFAGPCHKGTRELYYPLTRASNALVLFLRKLLRNTTTAPYDGVCSTLLYHGCTTVLTVCHPRVAPRLTVPCILPGVYVSSTRRKWPCLASAASLRPCRGKCKTEPEAADAVRWAWGGRGPLSVSGAAVAAI